MARSRKIHFSPGVLAAFCRDAGCAFPLYFRGLSTSVRDLADQGYGLSLTGVPGKSHGVKLCFHAQDSFISARADDIELSMPLAEILGMISAHGMGRTMRISAGEEFRSSRLARPVCLEDYPDMDLLQALERRMAAREGRPRKRAPQTQDNIVAFQARIERALRRA